MTLATYGPLSEGGADVPHAATLFYAVPRGRLELVFVGGQDSRHGRHVAAAGAEGAPAAATITEAYDDWRSIQGVQLWGRAVLLGGARKAACWVTYLAWFPFVRDLLAGAGRLKLPARVEVFAFIPQRAAWTDNTTGVFGRRETPL